MNAKRLIAVTALVTLTGCATTSQPRGGFDPIIDGGNQAQIDTDLRACQAHASRVQGAADRAVAGAIIGALIGGVLSHAIGADGFGNEMAAVGAIHGGLEGAGAGARDQASIVRNCMVGRGHRVLN